MFELALKRSGKVLTRRSIGEEPILIGRANESSIRLSDPEISRHHCQIEWKDGVLTVTDTSKNGTLVNGELKKEAAIDIGDTLSIGPWTVVVESSIGAVPAKTIASSPHATKVISFDRMKKELTTESIEIIVQSPDQATIRRKIDAGEITIGHHAACDISIADPFVSRKHAKIVNSDGALKLFDLASTNGTFLNGVKIESSSLGTSGQFSIGRSVITARVSRAAERILPAEDNSLGRMIGASRAMREVFSLITRVAPSDATVLVFGESGTGKELAARELHNLSSRKRGPFVAVNCGAVPASIIESQLFGHERGAFTGAVERVAGLFEQANSGTLFLDEIGEMPLELQTRLLRVLETHSIRRVGGDTDIPVDLRIVCATNRDLKRLVSEKRFREDLFYRLYVVPLHLPPLRDRLGDIELLARAVLKDVAAKGNMADLDASAIAVLEKHLWPGNVRELKNTIERSLLLAPKNVLSAHDILIDSSNTEAAVSEAEPPSLKNKERDLVIAALDECSGNLTWAAKKLGIARTTLQQKIKRYGITARS